MPRMMRVLGAAAVLACSSAHAQSLFSITATGGAQSPVTVGSSNLLDLMESAIETTGQFAPFAGENTTFAVSYGNVQNALTITKNSTNTQATLTFGPTGVTRTFNGVNQADLEQQIRDYLKKNGSDDVRGFLEAMNRLSVIAVSDGNPNATTARMAEFTYNRWGFFGDQTQSAFVTAEGKTEAAGTQFQVQFAVKGYEVGDFEGDSATVGVAATFNFTERIGLGIGGFATYNTIEDADIFHSSFSTGVPIRIVLPEGKTGLLWQVTPFLSAGASGSEDIAAGGLIVGGGVANHLGWRITERFTLAMANQISFYRGREVEWGDDFELDPGVEQAMLKNGVRASLGLDDRWALYGGVSLSNFLDDAAIDDWWTPEIGATFTMPSGSGFLFGLTGDIGDDYSALGARFIWKMSF
jgi:hypothetical protein